jgi:hypothetical protein
MSGKDALMVGRGVPGLVLRGAVVVIGLAIVLVPLTTGITAGVFAVLVPVVLAAAYAPASPAPSVIVVVAALMVTLADGDPLRAEVLVLIPLVHLFHVTCGLAGVFPAAGRVHLGALRAPILRFLLVQAVMAVVVALAAVLPAGRTAPVVEVAGLLALAGVALLVMRLHRVR